MTSTQKLLVIVAGVLLGSFLNAQQSVSLPSTSPAATVVPRLVSLSGKAVDAQGKNIIGIAGATFAIYVEQYAGAPLWMETQNIQADMKGNYTVQLGATKPEGLPLDLFTSGAARWLGVTINGGEEQPRILLLSVPYALKAADAETVGGLPASAFVLAAPPSSNSAATSASASAGVSASATPATSSDVTTSGGTVNALPLWTTGTNLQSSTLAQSGSGTTAKIGVNTTAPASTLDVNGGATVRGTLALPATGAATATAGKNSQAATLAASTYNSSTKAAVAQNFRWQAEPAGNNTATPSGTLNLLYSSGTTTPAETGLKISNKGLINFAAGQTFPTVTGNETVTGDLTASELVSTVATGAPPLKVASTTQVANLNASFLGGLPASAFATNGANAFVGTQSITGSVGIGTTSPTQALDLGTNNNMVFRVDPGNDTSEGNGGYALVGRGAGGVPNTWWTYTAAVGGGFGVPANSYSLWQYPPNATPGCCLNRFTILPAQASTDTGGTVQIDQNGNIGQGRTAGGAVKAMVYVNGYTPPYKIVQCFNSALTGAAATTPPCGINFTEGSASLGFWTFDLGFTVSDRFLSATIAGSNTGVFINAWATNGSLVGVSTEDSGGNGQGAYFYLMVF